MNLPSFQELNDDDISTTVAICRQVYALLQLQLFTRIHSGGNRSGLCRGESSALVPSRVVSTDSYALCRLPHGDSATGGIARGPVRLERTTMRISRPVMDRGLCRVLPARTEVRCRIPRCTAATSFASIMLDQGLAAGAASHAGAHPLECVPCPAHNQAFNAASPARRCWTCPLRGGIKHINLICV